MTPAEARAELRDCSVMDRVKAAIEEVENDLDRPWMTNRLHPEERDLTLHAHGRLIELLQELESLCDGPLGSRLANRTNAEAEADRDDEEPTTDMELAA